jgi:hypothetical protein
MQKGIKLVLLPPSGEPIINPTQDDIRAILKQNEEYWRKGSGDASFVNKGLMFKRCKGYGYYILDLDSFSAPLGDEKDKSLLYVDDMGGDPFLVPLCCFLNYERAERILLHFLHYEELMDHDNWHDIYEGQEEVFCDTELFGNCNFGDIIKIANGKFTEF